VTAVRIWAPRNQIGMVGKRPVREAALWLLVLVVEDEESFSDALSYCRGGGGGGGGGERPRRRPPGEGGGARGGPGGRGK